MFALIASPLIRWAGVGLLIAGVIAYRAWLLHDITAARAELAAAKAELAQCQGAAASAQAAIALQDRRVEELQAQARVAAAAAQAREARAAEAGAQPMAQAGAGARRIEGARVAPGCAAAIAWAAATGPELGQW